jgi:hypothetical protein
VLRFRRRFVIWKSGIDYFFKSAAISAIRRKR